MNGRKKRISIFLAGVLVLMCMSGAFAWGARNNNNNNSNARGSHVYRENRGGYNYGNYGSYGYRGNGGFYRNSYGYNGCEFWPYGAVDFNVMDPPIGSVFGYLPDGGAVIAVDGIGYYYYNGYYLRQCPAGYIVVSPPMSSTPGEQAHVASEQAFSAVPNGQPAQSESASPKNAAVVPDKTQASAQATSDYPIAVGTSITINIPNSKGGFTPVKLVKYKDGFIGPQDEFYSNHPTVDELRVLYGN